jgi:hypothetical protein
MVVALVIFSIVCFALSGIAKACADTVAFHYDKSIFKNCNPWYFDPRKSSVNKYKKDERGMLIVEKGRYKPKFFGSTTFLAFITDFWHLMDTCRSTFSELPFVACFMAMVGFNWYGCVVVLS